MTALWLFVAVLATPGVQGECRARPGGSELHVTVDGLETAVVGDHFVLAGADEENGAGGARPGASTEQPGRLIQVGLDTEGRSVELSLNGQWILRRGDETKRLRVPRSLAHAEHLRVLASISGGLWLAAPGVIARLDLERGSLATTRVGRRGVLPQLVEAADAVVVAVGRRLMRCRGSVRCEPVAELPARVDTVITGPGGWLYAVGGDAPGLYRADQGAPERPSRIVAGDVLALCDGGGGTAWAAVRGGDGIVVLSATTHDAAVRAFSRAELLARALLDTPRASAEAVVRVLEIAHREGWREQGELALYAMQDPRPQVRMASAQALVSVPGARGVAALWLLAHDPDRDVRLEALAATDRRCSRGGGLSCTQLLGAILTDADQETAWTARDLLLWHDVAAAFGGAPPSYKLEVIPLLVDRLERDPDRFAHRALALLRADQNPAVRAAAIQALNAALP